MSSPLTPADVTHVLANLRLSEDIAQPIVRSRERLWAVRFPDGPTVALEWVDDPVRIILSARLGMPVEARRTEVLETLMRYNALWDEAGGVRSAQVEGGAEVMLYYDWCAEEMAAHELPAIVQGLAALASMWRPYVMGNVPNAPDLPPNLLARHA